jgi:hypothetical protein
MQCYVESVMPKNVVEFIILLILTDDVACVLDPCLPLPILNEAKALMYIGYLAVDCVRPHTLFVGRKKVNGIEE